MEAVVASQEAFRSQVSSLKEINRTQQDNIKSLRAKLTEAKDRYGRLVTRSGLPFRLKLVSAELTLVWLRQW